jgi:hypothetical protein
MSTFSLLWTFYGLLCAGVSVFLASSGQGGNPQAWVGYGLTAAAVACVLAWAQSRTSSRS